MNFFGLQSKKVVRWLTLMFAACYNVSIMSLAGIRRQAPSQESADSQSIIDLVAKPARTRSAARAVNFDPNDYQIDHIAADSLADMVKCSQGDARLFVSFLNLHRFIDKLRFGDLGPEEDAVKLYDCYLADIDRRLGQLCLGKLSSLPREFELVA